MGKVGIRGLPSKKSTDRSMEGALDRASPGEHFREADKSLKSSARAGGGDSGMEEAMPQGRSQRGCDSG